MSETLHVWNASGVCVTCGIKLETLMPPLVTDVRNLVDEISQTSNEWKDLARYWADERDKTAQQLTVALGCARALEQERDAWKARAERAEAEIARRPSSV